MHATKMDWASWAAQTAAPGAGGSEMETLVVTPRIHAILDPLSRSRPLAEHEHPAGLPPSMPKLGAHGARGEWKLESTVCNQDCYTLCTTTQPPCCF